jgi:SAM-dependent methyltransferase
MKSYVEVQQQVGDYYTGKLQTHGATPKGVDWNSAESQQLRFQQLLRVCDASPFTLNDYGCGYGALATYLYEQGLDCDYLGFDISPAMIQAAQELLSAYPRVKLTDNPAQLVKADYTVASGIFNVKLDTEKTDWLDYILHTLNELWAFSDKGLAFNLLTSYSDPERMRSDLYYGQPTFFFDYCKMRFSRQVALLHDYGLYEFTIIVRRAS